jgi:hypothetical protein
LNLRHPACKASALPLSYPPEGLPVVAVFERLGKGFARWNVDGAKGSRKSCGKGRPWVML